MKTRIFFQAASAAVTWAFHGSAHACSVCINGAAGDRLVDAFNWSVIFLMAMPYTIVFTIIGFFVYAYRRAAQKQRAEDARAEEARVFRPVSDLS